MSMKGEKYKSKSAMAKHEKSESKSEMKKEYGSKGMKSSSYPPKRKK